MRHKKVFCTECDAFCEYYVFKSMERRTIRGITFEYEHMTPVCNRCGSEVYVGSVNDANIDRVRNILKGKGLKL